MAKTPYPLFVYIFNQMLSVINQMCRYCFT